MYVWLLFAMLMSYRLLSSFLYRYNGERTLVCLCCCWWSSNCHHYWYRPNQPDVRYLSDQIDSFLQLVFLFSLGSVLCSPEYPIRIASFIRSRIIVFNTDMPITLGYPVSSSWSTCRCGLNLTQIFGQSKQVTTLISAWLIDIYYSKVWSIFFLFKNLIFEKTPRLHV